MKTIWNRRWWILTSMLAVLAATLWWANNLPRISESSVVLAYSRNAENQVSQALALEVSRRLFSENELQEFVNTELFRDQRASGKTAAAIVSDLSRSTAVDADGGSSIRIRYRDRSPERAQNIVAGLAQVVEKINVQGGTFKVQQAPTLATGQIKPNRVNLTVFGLGGGVLLGLILAGLVELSSKFRNGKLAHTS